MAVVRQEMIKEKGHGDTSLIPPCP